MPGPEALRKRQYYGFEGNHFWHILPALFKVPRPAVYADRIRLLRDHRVAVWDVLESCVRPTALDSDIRECRTNDIPSLLRKYPGIAAVFVNGRKAHDLFRRAFDGRIHRPVFYLPSTSPAHAAMPLAMKLRKWGRILEYL